MKIGILTFHRPSNFGANLQAYSSVCYFQSLGHSVKIIDYVRPGDINYKSSVPVDQYEAHKSFVEARLPLTKQAKNVAELVEVVAEELFDAILIGADAVWRSPKDDNIFFAEWLFNDERLKSIPVGTISPAHMGAGYGDQSDDNLRRIKDCLLQFKYISVRDSWTQNAINRDIFSGENFIKVVNPDPVFMLSRFIDGEAWQSRGLKTKQYYLLSLPHNWNSGRYVFFRQRWFRRFKHYVNKSGCQLVEFPVPEGKSGMSFDACVDFPLDPIQWFLWIKNARGFCGLRFHAVVSSISCCTPFYSMDSYGCNSKKIMLLDFLGFHQQARKQDVSSKIRNLLINSIFENNRTGRNVEFESPRKVFRMLKSCKETDIMTFRDNMQKLFENNMSQLIKALKNE